MNRSNSDIISGNTFSNTGYDIYEAKDAFHQRGFLQAGVGILFLKRLELGMEYRGGFGYKVLLFGTPKITRLQSFGLTAKWVLK